MTRFLFSLLSISYISAIFFFAGFPVVEKMSSFNPYSLLHIPLYGILTILLIFSFIPLTHREGNSLNQRNQRNQTNQRNQIDQIDQTDQRNQTNQKNERNSLLVAGIIAFIVAVADEIHQSFVPNRNASFADVLLDLFGIIFVLSLLFYFHKKQKILKTQLTQ